MDFNVDPFKNKFNLIVSKSNEQNSKQRSEILFLWKKSHRFDFYPPKNHHKLSQQLFETLWSDKRQSLIKTNLRALDRCLVIVEIVMRLTCIINLLLMFASRNLRFGFVCDTLMPFLMNFVLFFILFRIFSCTTIQRFWKKTKNRWPEMNLKKPI